MSTLICAICGSNLQIENNDQGRFYSCLGCGNRTVIKDETPDDFIMSMNHANNYRILKNYGEALKLYENIIERYPNEASAYWGAFLAKFGITFVKDTASGTYKPTCHRLILHPVGKCAHYSNAIEKENDAKQKELYINQGKEIEKIRGKLADKSKDEECYDIFICYKSKADDGIHNIETKEAKWAAELYSELTYKYNYKVFFAAKTLPSDIGDYEPKIFKALFSSRFMIILATSLENLKSPWVSNEWSRYCEFKNDDPSKCFKVVYEGFEPYNMPIELQKEQAIDQDSTSWHEDLLASIAKAFKGGLNKIVIDGGKVGKKATMITAKRIELREIKGSFSGSGTIDIDYESRLNLIDNYLSHDNLREQAKNAIEKLLAVNGKDSEVLWRKVLYENCAADADEFLTKTISLSAVNLTSVKMIVENSRDGERAKEFLCIFSKYIEKCALNGDSKETLNEFVRYIIGYDYKTRNMFISKLLKIACSTYDESLFELLLSSLNSEDVDNYILQLKNYANAMLSIGVFEKAAAYFYRIIEIDESDIYAREGLLAAEINSKKLKIYDAPRLYKLNEKMTLLENILMYIPEDKELIKKILPIQKRWYADGSAKEKSRMP
ncbi:hypothetical protein EOM82_07460 [bacterium]|nr:hypothetical protein [bacterium]